MMYCDENYVGTLRTQDASGFSPGCLQQMYPALHAEGPEQPSQCAASKSLLTSHMRKKLGDIFTGVLLIGKRSCGLINPPFS